MIGYAVVHGLVLSILASAVLLGSIKYNPRLWLQDYPKDVREKAAPKTQKEKRESFIVGAVFVVLLFLVPTLSNWNLGRIKGGLTFFSAWANAFGIMLMFNLVDWLILDWLLLCAITPKFMVIPGTEGMKGYKNYWMHFRGFLIGTVFSLVGGLVIAAISTPIF